MKKFVFEMATMVVAGLITVSCSNNLVDISTETSYSEDSVDEAIVTLLEKTNVNLLEGVSENDIIKDVDSLAKVFQEKISYSTGRSVLETDTVINIEDVEEILSGKINSLVLPDLLNPTEEDIIRIQQDFPNLTEDEIIENFDTITSIYQRQVGLSAMDTLVESCNPSFEARSATYENGLIFGKITPLELAVCVLHPFSALTLSASKDKAIELTEKYMGCGTTGDDKGDAFRHTIWNVVLPKMAWGRKSEKLLWTAEITIAHENGIRYTGAASEMDLHNNSVGRAYYDKNSKCKTKRLLFIPIEIGVSEPSYTDACNSIKIMATNSTFVDKNQNLETIKQKISKLSDTQTVYIIPDTKKY